MVCALLTLLHLCGELLMLRCVYQLPTASDSQQQSDIVTERRSDIATGEKMIDSCQCAGTRASCLSSQLIDEGGKCVMGLSTVSVLRALTMLVDW